MIHYCYYNTSLLLLKEIQYKISTYIRDRSKPEITIILLILFKGNTSTQLFCVINGPIEDTFLEYKANPSLLYVKAYEVTVVLKQTRDKMHI